MRLTSLERAILNGFKPGGGWLIIDAALVHAAAVRLAKRGLLERRHTVHFRLANGDAVTEGTT